MSLKMHHALDINDDDESFAAVSEKIRRRSTINLGNTRQRTLRLFRLKVYNFLEKPLNAASAPYHSLIFTLVIINIILGAAASANDDLVSWSHFYLEVVLVLFFILEFIVRLWSVKADAKYRSRWGRIYYLFHTVTLIDLCIIPATILLLVFESRYVDGITLDSLRFIQILRLFHVDRQMATWKLLKKMIMLSKWHLFAAYYITIFLLITMATIIYSTEAYAQGLEDQGYGLNGPNETVPTFPTMAHSWWFTVVTVLTIGYGDIVPKGAFTKVVVCILGFLAFCTFQAANTQISVGMTLMMEEENKEKCQSRLRNIAASTIQVWWRYHLATNWKPHIRYVYFTHVCYKLYVTEERINQNRALAKKIREKLERKKSQKKKSIVNQGSVTAELLKLGIKGAVKPVIEADRNDKVAAFQRRTKKRVLFAERRNHTVETSMSSSLDISDVDAHIEMRNILAENVDDFTPEEVDISLLMKYRPLLRFYNFILFRFLMKKFRNQRKAGELLTIEEEISERENARNIKMKELEATIISLIGKPTISPFDYSGRKISLLERIDYCERKMDEMEMKVERIQEITLRIVDLVEGKIGHGRPPKHPGKKVRRHAPIPELDNVDDEEDDEDDTTE
ncbi:unnamed protein product [Caenorhabditis bovis]|uniref:Ion transport domain-containing protein n=1 Tax=Caenorhabditis bovis TaxID=2654633 RepID=A0A8S1EFK9_9PELO|nr:unnamed protein product [Caenorhabditis bovis]CAB3399589.1 unnamed protein product [Caenorhabditis bovis]